MRRRSLLCALVIGVAGANRVAVANPPSKVAVFGDSLADGLWAGLSQVCPDVSLVRLARVSSGLVKTGFYDWPAEAARIAAEPYAAGIACVGLNDQQTIATASGRFPFGTDDWDAAYAGRVADIVKGFVAHRLPLLWVGLPRVRDPQIASGVTRINGIFERVVPSAGGVFVPTWDFTSGPHGFDEYLPDETGRKVNMRAADGSHFTPEGYRFLARQVLARLRPDDRLKALIS